MEQCVSAPLRPGKVLRVLGAEIQLDDVVNALGVCPVVVKVLHGEGARVEANEESANEWKGAIDEPAAHSLKDLPAPSVHHQRHALADIDAAMR